MTVQITRVRYCHKYACHIFVCTTRKKTHAQDSQRISRAAHEFVSGMLSNFQLVHDELQSSDARFIKLEEERDKAIAELQKERATASAAAAEAAEVLKKEKEQVANLQAQLKEKEKEHQKLKEVHGKIEWLHPKDAVEKTITKSRVDCNGRNHYAGCACGFGNHTVYYKVKQTVHPCCNGKSGSKGCTGLLSSQAGCPSKLQ